MNWVRLAFGSKARVGKDTACMYALSLLGGQELRFADPLYNIVGHAQRVLNQPEAKSGPLMQTFGEALRAEYGTSVFANIAAERYRRDTQQHWFCADLRNQAEMMVMRDLGFVTVRVMRNNRIIDRDPYHSSENALDTVHFDETIRNDYSIEHLQACVNGIIIKHFPDSISRHPWRTCFATISVDHDEPFPYATFGRTKHDAEMQFIARLAELAGVTIDSAAFAYDTHCDLIGNRTVSVGLDLTSDIIEAPQLLADPML